MTTIEQFRNDMESSYISAFRRRDVRECRKKLFDDVWSLVLDDEQWSGLVNIIEQDDSYNACHVIEYVVSPTLHTPGLDNVIHSRFLTVFVALSWKLGAPLDDVLADATKTVLLDQNNVVARKLLVDIIKDFDEENK